jgi:hypothetical protein
VKKNCCGVVCLFEKYFGINEFFFTESETAKLIFTKKVYFN